MDDAQLSAKLDRTGCLLRFHTEALYIAIKYYALLISIV